MDTQGLRILGIIFLIWIIAALIWGTRGFLMTGGITVILAGIWMIWAAITGNY